MEGNLYEIAERYLSALEKIQIDPETGEILGGIELDKAAGALEEKVEAVACYIKDRRAFAESMKAEEKALRERRETIEKRVEWLKDWLDYNMSRAGLTALETARARVSFRNSKAVLITEEERIPDRFMKTKTETAPDRLAIKKVLSAGGSVPGAELIERKNIQIR